MQGIFAQIGGIMSESCAAFKDGDEGKCSSYANCEPVARVSDSKHVRISGEDDIKREILMNGAVQTSWNPPAAFQVYKKGILEGFGEGSSLA